MFSPSGSHTILVFPYQTGWRYSHWNPPNWGVECKWGICRNRDSGLIAGYRRLLDVRSAKHSYRRPCSVDRTVGDAPLNVGLWRPAAWTNTPKRRKQKKNLIVRSGISEAETINNKRLHSTFGIEASRGLFATAELVVLHFDSCGSRCRQEVSPSLTISRYSVDESNCEVS